MERIKADYELVSDYQLQRKSYTKPEKPIITDGWEEALREQFSQHIDLDADKPVLPQIESILDETDLQYFRAVEASQDRWREQHYADPNDEPFERERTNA